MLGLPALSIKAQTNHDLDSQRSALPSVVTGGAITTVLGVGFVPHLFAPLLPTWWQENVMSSLPSQTAESVMFGHLASAPATGHDPLVGGVVVVAWLVVVLGAAYVILRKRDC